MHHEKCISSTIRLAFTSAGKGLGWEVPVMGADHHVTGGGGGLIPQKPLPTLGSGWRKGGLAPGNTQHHISLQGYLMGRHKARLCFCLLVG